MTIIIQGAKTIAAGIIITAKELIGLYIGLTDHSIGEDDHTIGS